MIKDIIEAVFYIVVVAIVGTIVVVSLFSSNNQVSDTGDYRTIECDKPQLSDCY